METTRELIYGHTGYMNLRELSVASQVFCICLWVERASTLTFLCVQGYEKTLCLMGNCNQDMFMSQLKFVKDRLIVRFEVLVAVTKNSAICWDLTLCSLCIFNEVSEYRTSSSFRVEE